MRLTKVGGYAMSSYMTPPLSWAEISYYIRRHLQNQDPVSRVLFVGQKVYLAKFRANYSISVYWIKATSDNTGELARIVNSRLEGRKFLSESDYWSIAADILEDALLQQGFSYHKTADSILMSTIMAP
jgi:hypothetical protein